MVFSVQLRSLDIIMQNKKKKKKKKKTSNPTIYFTDISFVRQVTYE